MVVTTSKTQLLIIVIDPFGDELMCGASFQLANLPERGELEAHPTVYH